jgi:predicted SprT family Zn-dependent metalloprotease
METWKYECRTCKQETVQIERIVTDLLPPNVKTLECTVCGNLGVTLIFNPNVTDYA